MQPFLRIYLVLTLLFPSVLVAAQGQPLRLSLRDAMRLSLEKQVDVVIAKERVQQAMARLGQARSALLPQVTGTLSESRQTRNLQAMGITIPGVDPVVGPYNAFDARASMTQSLFDAGAFQRFKAARVGQRLSEVEALKVEEDVLALVAALYLEAQRAEQGVRLAGAIVARNQRQNEIAKTLRDLGQGSVFNVTQTTSDLQTSRHQLEESKTQALSRRLDLLAVLDLDQDQKIIFADRDFLQKAKVPSEAEVMDLLASHPDNEAAQETVRLRRLEKSAERADILPRVNAAADYGANGNNPSGAARTYSYGLQMTLPIFRGGFRHHKIKEAESRIRESEARVSRVGKDVITKALSARAILVEARAGLTAAEVERAEAFQRLSLARERLASGLGSEWDVTDTGALAALAEDKRNEAQAAYRLAQVRLSQATGRLVQEIEREK